MKSNRAELFFLAAIVLGTLCSVMTVGGYFAVQSSATARKSMRLALKEMPVFLTLLEIVLVIGIILLVVNVLKQLSDVWIKSAQRDVIYMGPDGQAPLVSAKRHIADPVQPGVRAVSALAAAHTHSGLKMPATAVRSAVHAAQYAPTWANVNRPALAATDAPADAEWRDLPERVTVYDAPIPPMPALAVGVTANGHLHLPLHNLGNVLIGGLPGSGKSELMAAMMTMIVRCAARGNAVQFAVIDTKMIDFGNIPAALPMLWRPVATDMTAGNELIQAMQTETQARFRLLANAGARSLRQYNEHKTVRLPYLVVFVDELADWAGDKAFNEIALDIGRKGRAAGVSLVLATQRPSGDVVNTSLRAVAGAAIAFRVRTGHDSRTILGDGGAELIPAHTPGRCLVARGEMQPCQAYMAGIDAHDGQPSQFDQFLATALANRHNRLHNRPPQPPPTLETTVTTVATATTATTAENTYFDLQPLSQPLEPGRRPPAHVAAWMRRAYANGMSKTELCLRVWGYKDGVVWAYMEEAISS